MATQTKIFRARPKAVPAAALAMAVAWATALGTLTLGAAQAAAETGNTLTGNYLAGRHAQAKRDLSMAADYLGAALEQAPDIPDLLRRTFVLMAVEGRMTEAAGLARRLVAANPKAAVANVMLAVMDIKQKRFATAGSRLDELPETGLSGLVVPVLRAWVLVGENKPDAALEILKPGVKKKATRALHTLHVALINQMQGRGEEAEKNYLGVNDGQDGMSFRVVQLLGSLYERDGKPDKAEALYKRFLDEQPGSRLLDAALTRLKTGAKPKPLVVSAIDGAAEVLFGISSSLRQQNARETAMVLARLALYLKPRFPVMQILLGDVLEADDRLEPALNIYKSIDRKSAFSWSARHRAASILDRLERTDEAVKHLRSMARESRDDAGPLVNLGDILRSHDRFAEAVQAYDEAIQRIKTLEPRHWTLLYARGIAHERSQQWPRAEADFLKALELKVDQPYVLNYLGYSWIEKGVHLDKAQEMINKAANLRPNDGYIVDSLGWGNYQLGNYEKAVRELERAVELRPQDPIINDHLGDAYWRVGRHREARFQWNRSLSLDPEEDLIPKIRQKLKDGLAEDTETAKKPGNDG